MPPNQAPEAVRDYYEKNTRLFLWLGGSRRTLTIHRAVWGEGVLSRAQALEYTNHRILQEIQALPGRGPAEPLRLLDLGCGVGGSLFYLARNLGQPLQALGVTLSPLQVCLASQQARQLGYQERCRFIEADFAHLPELQPVDLAFSIEAFILGSTPGAFFAQAGRALKPGGRLVLCDDFLTPLGETGPLTPVQARWLADFRRNWQAVGLSSLPQVEQLARQAGLQPVSGQDLTPFLCLHSLRHRCIALLAALGRSLLLRWRYGQSLVGGNGLTQCLLAGVLSYRFLVFIRER